MRFYATPDRAAFACVFARALPDGAPVALYAGVVRRENRSEEWRPSDVYAWELDKNDTHLIINAGERGGVARFINAEMFRRGGKSTVNCKAVDALDVDLLMPTVALHTTRRVEQLTECICDYGERYWPAIKTHLVEVWEEYLSMARYVLQVTAEYMVASGMSPNRLSFPLPAQNDETYHWAPDEVQYPIWPIDDASTREPPVAKKNGKHSTPMKRTSKP